MRRRRALKSLLALATVGTANGPANGRVQAGVERLAAACRRDGRDLALLLDIDWGLGVIKRAVERALPGRGHGLVPLADGGVLVLGNRPGRWLMRLDADGGVVAQRHWADRPWERTLNGHAIVGTDATTVLGTETDPATGRGWIGIRDLRTLEPVGAFETQGRDPHQLLHAEAERLVVANGGLARDALGRRVAGEPVDSSLVVLDASSGRLEGRWTLPDRELSLRHLAWSHDGQRLGVALQAAHALATDRVAAPLLAVLHEQTLAIPVTGREGGGYAGDIVAAAGGGFVLSAQRCGCCLWWHPGAPRRYTRVAELAEPCALAPSDAGEGVAIGAGLGAARWHSAEAPRLLPWPTPLAPDNHWVRLQLP
jgi:uncharacterized protein